MLTVTDYTTYNSIRVIVGLNSKEITDALLAEEVYAYTLETDLLDIDADIVTDYATASGEVTDEAKAFVRTFRLFAAHSVALKVAEALPLLSQKAITDGKAGIYRDGNSPYKVAMDKISAGFDKAKVYLESAYGTYSETGFTAATPVNLMGTSGLAVDPVTGE